jgi:hypothetical protein
LVWLKSPLAPSEEMMSAVFPLFVRVTGCAALEVPTSCEPKVSDEGENAATAARPVPLKLTGAGGVLLLLDSDNDPVRLPRAAGLKTTLIVQLVPGSRDAAQLLLWLKSPLTVMLLIKRGAVPVLLSVTVWAALALFSDCEAKTREVGEKAAIGAAVPVPANVMEDEAGVPLLVTVSAPLRLPAAAGTKVTLIVHAVPTAKVVAQLFVWAKSPETLIWLILNAPSPLLVSVTG